MNLHHAVDARPLRGLARWLLALAIFAAPIAAFAGVFVSVNIAPPPLPVYAQPVMPGPGYLWTPGYWRWSDDGYFWVPGTWVLAPYAGALWTPGYWGWGGGYYVFHAGYWGPHIGFYGGINYGFGYTGIGFAGGYWRGGVFNYNRSVTNISNTTNITNVYNKNVVNNTTVNNRTSFNGGTGGVAARPSPAERLAARDQHTAPTAAQQQHILAASRDASLRAAVNHGAPAIAATPTPAAFNARGLVRANPATPQAQAATARAAQAKAITAAPRTAAPARNNGASVAMRSSQFAPARTQANHNQRQAAQLRGPNATGHSASRAMAPNQPRTTRMSAPRQQPHPQAAPHRSDAPHRDGEQHRS